MSLRSVGAKKGSADIAVWLMTAGVWRAEPTFPPPSPLSHGSPRSELSLAGSSARKKCLAVLNSHLIEVTNTSLGNGNPCTGDSGAALGAAGPPSCLRVPTRTQSCSERAEKSIQRSSHSDTGLHSSMLNAGEKKEKKKNKI